MTREACTEDHGSHCDHRFRLLTDLAGPFKGRRFQTSTPSGVPPDLTASILSSFLIMVDAPVENSTAAAPPVPELKLAFTSNVEVDASAFRLIKSGAGTRTNISFKG